MLANFETPSRVKMLKVWGRRSSFNVQKVMWLIGELGLEHRHIDAGGRFGGLDTSAFLAMNPHGRVPVIQDGDATVWESHAIVRYLAARHGAGHFWSGDPAVRAVVDGWMDWSQTSLQPDFLVGVFWGFYRTPEDKRHWPTSPPERRCTGISNWRSSVRRCRRSNAGIARLRNAPRFAITS